MKIDFTEVFCFLKKNKLPLFLFFSVMTSFFLYNFHYVMITKQYTLFLINIAYGLLVYLVYDFIIGRKIYYTKMNINHTKSRENNNIEENIISKEGKNNTK